MTLISGALDNRFQECVHIDRRGVSLIWLGYENQLLAVILLFFVKLFQTIPVSDVRNEASMTNCWFPASVHSYPGFRFVQSSCFIVSVASVLN